MTAKQPLFSGGRNIAMKIPPHEFDDVVRFYRDVLGLGQLNEYLPAVVFEYASNFLWLDCVDTMTQAELWLELCTPDTSAAAAHLDRNHVVRCESVETLPPGFDGFWICAPGNIVHLVRGTKHDN